MARSGSAPKPGAAAAIKANRAASPVAHPKGGRSSKRRGTAAQRQNAVGALRGSYDRTG